MAPAANRARAHRLIAAEHRRWARPVTRSAVNLGKLDVAAGLRAEAAVTYMPLDEHCSRPGHCHFVPRDPTGPVAIGLVR